MRRYTTQNKAGLIKACITNLNQIFDQVAAYTTYGEGCHRGKGPTIFELAYRNANTIGFPKAFINTLNLTVSHTMKYDPIQMDPLHEDLWTGLDKRKVHASGNI